MSSIKKKNAFTIIELMIVLSLTALILGTILSIFINGNKIFSYSDVKTTLQMEAMNIQEKITEIGMQGINVERCESGETEIQDEKYGDLENDFKLVDIDGQYLKSKEWIDITLISINAATKDSQYNSNEDSINTKIATIAYNSDNKILSIDGVVILGVDSIRIHPIDIKDKNSTIAKATSIEFYIVLSKSQGFSQEVKYPINFTITFRNKEIQTLKEGGL